MLTGLGGPLAWARLHAHRDYWQNRDDCPRYFAYHHGLLTDFWLNLHLRFVPTPAAAATATAQLPDGVLDDPWLQFLERTWPLHTALLAAALAAGWGLPAVAVCVCFRVAAGILGHWFVGYAAHVWGEQPARRSGATESGTNVWLLGVLSFGEGFHNHHHMWPHSPRMGLGRHEWDLGHACLRAMQRLGWVRLHGTTARPSSADTHAVSVPGPAPRSWRPMFEPADTASADSSLSRRCAPLRERSGDIRAAPEG